MLKGIQPMQALPLDEVSDSEPFLKQAFHKQTHKHTPQ